MTIDPDDLFTLCWKIQDDLKAAQAKMTELRGYLSQLNLPKTAKYVCDHCSITFPSRMKLLDHAVLVHDDQAAEDEREAEWERLASLAQQSEPTGGQTRFEEDPERRAEIAADVRRRFCAEPEPATPDPKPPLGEPEPVLGITPS